MEFLKNKKSQGKVREFCCVKFIFSQCEHPTFEIFLEDYASRPPLAVLDTHKKLIVVLKTQGKAREFHLIWRLDILHIASFIQVITHGTKVCFKT